MFVLGRQRAQHRRGRGVRRLSRLLRRRARNLMASADRLIRGGRRRQSEWLAARVRTKLERIIARPHGIEVTVEDGRVLLSGPILAGELDPLLSTVWRVPGVGQVDARVELYESPAEIAAADPQQPRPARVPLPGREGPAFRFVAVLSAAGVAGYGLLRMRQLRPHP